MAHREAGAVLRFRRILCEIKAFFLHAEAAKSADIYSLLCFTLALESAELHQLHGAPCGVIVIILSTDSTEARRIRDFGDSLSLE